MPAAYPALRLAESLGLGWGRGFVAGISGAFGAPAAASAGDSPANQVPTGFREDVLVAGFGAKELFPEEEEEEEGGGRGSEPSSSAAAEAAAAEAAAKRGVSSTEASLVGGAGGRAAMRGVLPPALGDALSCSAAAARGVGTVPPEPPLPGASRPACPGGSPLPPSLGEEEGPPWPLGTRKAPLTLDSLSSGAGVCVCVGVWVRVWVGVWVRVRSGGEAESGEAGSAPDFPGGSAARLADVGGSFLTRAYIV